MKKVILILGGLLFSILTIPLLITKKIYKRIFGIRYNQSFDYFEVIREKRAGFTRKRSFFLSDKAQKLVGFFYYQPSKLLYKGIVIWVHGMRTSHENYLGEIAYLTKSGYLVFAYDNTGVGKSEGNTLIGLTQAPIDLSYAISHIAQMEKLKKLPLILVGHSWGGFAVTSVCSNPVAKEVRVIVSISGFEKNTSIIKECGKSAVGKWIGLLMPYVEGYERILFPKDRKIRGIKGVLKSKAAVLFIHCEDDNIVKYNENFKLCEDKFKRLDRVHFMSLKEGGHRPTLRYGTFERICELTREQRNYPTGSLECHHIEEKKCALSLSVNRKTMKAICDFIDKNLEMG